jgi:diguanylate cyclase (GGDEF)-like protein
MFPDLDNFKPLNDRHELGDLLLREVAWRLKTCVREQDTVSRIGGDEFVVSLSDLSECPAESRAQDSSVAEKILTLLADPYVLKVGAGGAPGRTVAHHCSASIGVTLFSPHGTDQAQILQRADAAMYQAKDGGRNRVQSSQGQG